MNDFQFFYMICGSTLIVIPAYLLAPNLGCCCSEMLLIWGKVKATEANGMSVSNQSKILYNFYLRGCCRLVSGCFVYMGRKNECA